VRYYWYLPVMYLYTPASDRLINRSIDGKIDRKIARARMPKLQGLHIETSRISYLDSSNQEIVVLLTDQVCRGCFMPVLAWAISDKQPWMNCCYDSDWLSFPVLSHFLSPSLSLPLLSSVSISISPSLFLYQFTIHASGSCYTIRIHTSSSGTRRWRKLQK